ncbi:MAG: toll/interleukin-1 receptor domain-containing protein [Thermoanaerobaculia bacterium]
MADIFVSYSRRDLECVQPLVDRFRAAGWTVFQDKDTPTGARWRKVIETELKEAGCVVAVWTKNSVGSTWVLKEADAARKERKLISVRMDSTEPPPHHREEQAADLSNWRRAGDIAAVGELFDEIAKVLGKRNGVVVVPVADHWSQGLAVVLGRPLKHPNVGAAVNMTCGFNNKLDRAATVHKLVASIAEPKRQVSYSMDWNLVFDVVGGGSDHVLRWEEENLLRIPTGERFVTGIQFQAPTLMNKVFWPEGDYEVRIRGWVNREEHREANLRCSFDAELDYRAAQEIAKHQGMSDEQWRAKRYHDDAYGVPFKISGVRSGLPAA